MSEPTAFDQITWLPLLYLWTATDPIDVADTLCRTCRDPVREEIAKALWRKAKRLDEEAGNKTDFHQTLLCKTYKVPEPESATTKYAACQVCRAALLVAPAADGSGGLIYAYQCTSEIRIKSDGRGTVIKKCPDVGRVGREQPVLGDASVQKERKG